MLSAAQMLDPAFDFDAVMEIAHDGESRSASARAMLQAGHVESWTQGPIATSVIIADHSVVRQFDMGFDDLRSIRPIFHATFWPAIGSVQVRVIGENCNTETLKDVQYSLVLKAGAKTPREVYRQDLVPHYLAARWTRTFWIGRTPNQAIDVDHNLTYLAATRAFPNFDTGLDVSDTTVRRTYASWQKSARSLFDAGTWMKYMPTTGGRDDIGPYPGYATKWLYTGDHRLLEIVSTQADLAAAWPAHVREGDPTKWFDAEHKISGLGRPISVHARPSLWLFDSRDHSRPEDKLVLHEPRILGNSYPKGSGGWSFDGSHQPDPYSALYTLSGDPFALEQMQFWAARQALSYHPGYKGIAESGIFMDQVRGCGWVLRNRVHAAFLSPDASPEQTYFTRLVDDVVAYWEGRMGLHGSGFDGNPAWRIGEKDRFPSPLHFFHCQPTRGDEGVLPNRASRVDALWQHYMLLFELGRAKEKGYPTGPLLSWLAEVLIGQFREGPGYSPYNLQRYYTAVVDEKNQYMKTWTETLAAYKNQDPGQKFIANVSDGYGTYAYGASTMLVGEPGGRDAYVWLRKNGFEPLRDRFAENPKWAFLPRDEPQAG